MLNTYVHTMSLSCTSSTPEDDGVLPNRSYRAGAITSNYSKSTQHRMQSSGLEAHRTFHSWVTSLLCMLLALYKSATFGTTYHTAPHQQHAGYFQELHD